MTCDLFGQQLASATTPEQFKYSGIIDACIGEAGQFFSAVRLLAENIGDQVYESHVMQSLRTWSRIVIDSRIQVRAVSASTLEGLPVSEILPKLVKFPCQHIQVCF